MVRGFLVCGLLMSALQVATYGDDKSAKLPPAPTNAGLEKIKKLAGTWVAADKDGKPTDQVVSIVKVTAGGSAVHETLFPRSAAGNALGLHGRGNRPAHDALLRARQPTAHEGRPEFVRPTRSASSSPAAPIWTRRRTNTCMKQPLPLLTPTTSRFAGSPGKAEHR